MVVVVSVVVVSVVVSVVKVFHQISPIYLEYSTNILLQVHVVTMNKNHRWSVKGHGQRSRSKVGVRGHRVLWTKAGPGASCLFGSLDVPSSSGFSEVLRGSPETPDDFLSRDRTSCFLRKSAEPRAVTSSQEVDQPLVRLPLLVQAVMVLHVRPTVEDQSVSQLLVRHQSPRLDNKVLDRRNTWCLRDQSAVGKVDITQLHSKTDN